MATITTNTTITLPAGQMLVFGLGGSATAIIDGNVYELGLGEKFFGPFTANESVQVVVRAGTITYSIETDGTVSREVTIDPATQRAKEKTALDSIRAAAIPVVSVASTLVSMYEQQRNVDAIYGPMLLARSSLPVAGNTPTITAASGNPSSDSDAATQVLWPFLSDASGDVLSSAQKSAISYVRGHSPKLQGVGFGDSLRVASRCTTYGQNGNQDIDASNGYGIDRALVTIDLTLDGDVLFLRNQTGSASQYEIYVNGSLVTAAAGANVTLVNSRSYQPGATWLKLKWSSVDRRRVMIVCAANQIPREIRTRITSTITPSIATPIKWAHFGDSFSQYSGAEVSPGVVVPTLGCTSWLHAAFGYNCHFLDASCGSTGILKSAGDNNGVGQNPVVGQKPTFRQQWRLSVQGSFVPDVVTFLAGHNDVGSDALTVELAKMFSEILEANPNCIIIPIGANTSPTLIASGADFVVENAIVAAANGLPNVYPVRLQNRPEGRFLRGSSGNTGATAGLGNVDLYTSSDNVHPSLAGHRAYGRDAMAAGMYNVLKSLAI
jgi:lysophospholipase L1-like esterase